MNKNDDIVIQKNKQKYVSGNCVLDALYNFAH